jgi:hypothetical protein
MSQNKHIPVTTALKYTFLDCLLLVLFGNRDDHRVEGLFTFFYKSKKRILMGFKNLN